MSCTNEENNYDLKDLELNFGVKASISRIDDNSIFFENVIYGEKSRNKLDIHIPDIESPKGLIIFFHGGAFVGGDKSDIFEEYLSSTFLKIIKEGIIIVSANYSFLDSEGSKGVLSSSFKFNNFLFCSKNEITFSPSSSEVSTPFEPSESRKE